MGTKALIENSQLIISVASAGITKEQIDTLRKAIPKETKAAVVKNSLMKVALKGSEFESLGENLKNENMFFFIPEGEARTTYEEFEKWAKETKREKEGAAKVAVMDGVKYEGPAAIKNLSKLPTKLELITKIGLLLRLCPLRLVRGLMPCLTSLVVLLVRSRTRLQRRKEGLKGISSLLDLPIM